MKILQLCNKYPYPANDGGNIAVTNLSTGFILHGHELFILAMSTHKHPENNKEIPELFKKKAIIKSVHINISINPFKLLYNFFFSKLPYNAERFINKTFSIELVKILSENKFDIIQLEGLYLTPYIDDIRKHSNSPIAVRTHNIESEIWERSLALDDFSIKKWYLKTLTQRMKSFELEMLKKADIIIPITARDGEKIAEMGITAKQKVIPCAFNFAKTESNLDTPTENNIFFLGALDWAPNQGGLLWFIENVWDRISKELKDVKFYIAGRNAPSWLKNELKGLNIIYLGEIENAYQYMASKSLMIVPIFYGGGMRVKIIEGMALGKLIITTTIGKEGIECVNNKEIVIANTAHEFYDKIVYYLQQPDEVKKISLNAKKFIENNFDNTLITKELIDFYTPYCK